MALMEVRDVVAGYGASDEILKGVSLAVGERELVCIIGPNGAGKSTLLKVVAGLLRPRRGTVAFAGNVLTGAPPRQIARAGVAYVAQEQNVFPSLTVRENLLVGSYLHPASAEQRCRSMMERFPVLRERKDRAARTLSGGQRQTLAVAAALMAEPRMLVLDEPSAGLSPKVTEELFATLAGIRAQGVSILMVEQNALAALAVADRAYIFVLGRNEREGAAAAIAADPEIRRVFLGG
ncbi:MAG: ABC transporter ATP-binding protein [Proteobacteria bacterium]|nr:ABC transporter ATP-binding protein [Pseudomonadota bacterium]